MIENEWIERIAQLEEKVDHYKTLWNEETQLVEQIQKDKDFIDKKLMVIQGIVNELPYNNVYKTLLTKLIMKARSKV